MRVLAVAFVALALPAAAAATIVPQRGIAGVRLHMTTAQVRARLGRPPAVRKGRNDFGRYTTFFYSRVRVTFQGGNRVTGLRTTSRLERTASGVGVGSTKASVKAHVAGATCGVAQCFLGSFMPGRTVTSFVVRHGRVSAVVVGIVLD
jgi:hypothetical protein